MLCSVFCKLTDGSRDLNRFRFDLGKTIGNAVSYQESINSLWIKKGDILILLSYLLVFL